MTLQINPIAPTSGEPQADRILSTRKIVMQTNRTPASDSMRGEVPPREPGNIPGNSQSDADEETKPLSPQYAALAKTRRALQVKERALMEREKALSETNKGWIDPATLKSSPLRVLLDQGVTYDQLTQEILNSQHNPEIDALKKEIEALRTGVDTKFKTTADAQEQQALREMAREAEQLAKSSPDFELIQATRSVPDVIRLIETTYRKTGEVIPVTEAMKLVEDELLADSMKLAKIEKIRNAIAPKEQLLAPKTLTSRNSATQPMTAKQRALAAFYGTLNKG